MNSLDNKRGLILKEYDLKSCPFCGNKVAIYKSALIFNCEAKVMCPICRVQTATYKEPVMENAIWFAVNAWNRRTTEE